MSRSGPATTSSDRPDATTGRRALLVILCLALVPWSILRHGGTTLVYAWGTAGLDPLHVTTLPAYLFRHTRGLPAFLLAWPTAVLCYLVAVASAALGVATGREDVRVTAGTLVLAGLALLSFAAGFSVQPGRVAYPGGTVVLWAVAVGLCWPHVRDGGG